jgi:hypothetical protein
MEPDQPLDGHGEGLLLEVSDRQQGMVADLGQIGADEIG